MGFMTRSLMEDSSWFRQFNLFCWRKFVFCLLALLAACNSQQVEKQDGRGGTSSKIKVVPYQVSYTHELIEIQAVGTARAVKTAILRPQGSGEVSEVNFTAGQQVKQGEMLVSLESEEEKLAVEAARVALKDAQQLIKRFDGIELPGAISDSRVDEAKIAADRAQIDLQLALIELEKRQIRAPFSGIVGLTDIDPGARIDINTEIARLDDRSTLYVDFQAPEEVYGRFTIGSQIEMEPFAKAGQIFHATVHKIDSRIDQASRSFTVRAVIDNSQDQLRPGMSFKINVEIPGRSFPQVPEAAIIWGGDGPYIWLVDNEQTRRQSVTIVSRKQGMVLVNAPIKENAIVIAEGVQKVREGTQVEFVNPYGVNGVTDPEADDSESAPVQSNAKSSAEELTPLSTEVGTTQANQDTP